MPEPISEAQHAAYQRLRTEPEFHELRKRRRSFVLPFTVVFLAWYVLYVVCANWASGFMNTKVVGHINIALIFGLLQFVSTFLIAFFYSRHSNRKLDPLAESLDADYRREVGE